MVPLHADFGWSMSSMSLAVSVNLLLYGLTAPFAAALMDRFGIRQVVAAALALVALGAGGSVLMTASWQLLIFWGVLIGLGTGSMALVFAATIADCWFLARRGLVMGILTAGSATGQLIFLPPVATIAESTGWRPASLLIGIAAMAAVPLAWFVLRDHPSDLGVLPYGAVDTDASTATDGAPPTKRRGTVFSGWLTDKFDPRILLVAYYAFRGVGLLLLPWLLSDTVHPSMILFIVVHGLDWVATVPPTAALCREIFGDNGTIVFGWVFAAHQSGAAGAAFAAGVVRDAFGEYTYAWWGGAAMCVIAAVLSFAVKRRLVGDRREPATAEAAA